MLQYFLYNLGIHMVGRGNSKKLVTQRNSHLLKLKGSFHSSIRLFDKAVDVFLWKGVICFRAYCTTQCQHIINFNLWGDI